MSADPHGREVLTAARLRELLARLPPDAPVMVCHFRHEATDVYVPVLERDVALVPVDRDWVVIRSECP